MIPPNLATALGMMLVCALALAAVVCLIRGVRPHHRGNPRPMTTALDKPLCDVGGCGRLLARGDEGIRPRLPEVDFCRFCARPITERGERLADNAGFVRWAKLFTGRRPAARHGHALPETV